MEPGHGACRRPPLHPRPCGMEGRQCFLSGHRHRQNSGPPRRPSHRRRQMHGGGGQAMAVEEHGGSAPLPETIRCRVRPRAETPQLQTLRRRVEPQAAVVTELGHLEPPVPAGQVLPSWMGRPPQMHLLPSQHGQWVAAPRYHARQRHQEAEETQQEVHKQQADVSAQRVFPAAAANAASAAAASAAPRGY